jgi:hypothetical protein
MKVLYFIKWWWNRLSTWQKLWMFASGLFGAGLVEQGPMRIYLLSVLPAFVLLSMLKWAFWDTMKDNWNEYNREQEKLIEIMKETK